MVGFQATLGIAEPVEPCSPSVGGDGTWLEALCGSWGQHRALLTVLPLQ